MYLHTNCTIKSLSILLRGTVSTTDHPLYHQHHQQKSSTEGEGGGDIYLHTEQQFSSIVVVVVVKEEQEENAKVEEVHDRAIRGK